MRWRGLEADQGELKYLTKGQFPCGARCSRRAPGEGILETDLMTMFGSTKIALVAGLLVFGAFASPASAQRADDMRGGGGNPCVGDAQRICSEFIPDRGKVASCLFKNKAKLTPA